MNIVFKLKDEDIRIIANCIREDRDKIQDLIPQGKVSNLLIIPATSTPNGVSAHIELMLRRYMVEDDLIHIYSHLCYQEKDCQPVSKLLYPNMLSGDMLMTIKPSEFIPYTVVFEREDA